MNLFLIYILCCYIVMYPICVWLCDPYGDRDDTMEWAMLFIFSPLSIWIVFVLGLLGSVGYLIQKTAILVKRKS